MQTFLPYPDFKKSAEVLDTKRLGKQRVEAYQLLKTLTGLRDGWKNHPACLMWKGFEPALRSYAITMCEEWTSRGFADTVKESITFLNIDSESIILPPWFGDESFHASHRSNLLRKDPIWYSKFGWSESSDLPYIWPKV